jgi:hypothetical protein
MLGRRLRPRDQQSPEGKIFITSVQGNGHNFYTSMLGRSTVLEVIFFVPSSIFLI